MKLIIGLVGQKGCGKETVAGLIKDVYGTDKVSHVRMSDILKETLKMWSIPETRTNLQRMAIIMNRHFGKGTLSKAVNDRIMKERSTVVVLDGIRWISDEKLVRSFDKNILIHIKAKSKIRFQRLKMRSDKIGEGRMNYKQFLKEEKVYTELFIKEIGNRADIILENNSSVKDLKKSFNLVWKTVGKNVM